MSSFSNTKSRRASNGHNSRTAHVTATRGINPATEAARARPRSIEACEADLHGSAHAAKEYDCICPEALADRAEQRAREADRMRQRRAAEREVRNREELRAMLAQPVDQLEVNADGLQVRPYPAERLIGNVGRRVLRGVDKAACVGEDPELFFGIDEASVTAAKSICRRCPVQDSCFTWALQEGFDGVFGGTTADERSAIRRSWKRVA